MAIRPSTTKPNAATESKPKAKRQRDPAATKQRIADAAVQMLSEKGFTALGINAIAASAGIDKQMIYYHFGGFEGLIRHIGSQLDVWLGEVLPPVQGEPYAKAVYRLMMAYNKSVRDNVMVQRLLAWELVEPSAVLQELELARSSEMLKWVAQQRAAALPAPDGVDAPAINAVLMAGLNYLALRERSVGRFMSVDLSTPEGIARIAKAVEFLTEKTFAAAVPGGNA